VVSSATLTNPENWNPKPESAPLKDRGIRLIMIPAFGVIIPHLTGYFGPLRWHDWKYWAGLLWGVIISFTIWHGNRYFLLKQRQHLDWFSHPIRKIAILLFACIFYTAPCSVLMMLAWYAFAGFGPDWAVIRAVTLACIICVAFITHVYETVYLIQQRESDMVAVERLERARTQAELEALKAQVAPHFLFNSLNTLAWLIENSPDKALSFNQDLAEVYRYILVARRREVVPLDEEWTFLRQYCSLLKLRFEESLRFEFEEPGKRLRQWYLPPISLQVVVENAVKHNEHSAQNPLSIRVAFGEDAVAVSNELRPRARVEPSAQTGLRTLDERCRLAFGRPIEVTRRDGQFTVRVPVRRS
jgi:hypothetical protein